ncbi:hypothetical protein HDU84_005989 [Entophlyctis sp. JEL0112]|nr:hypothetical protein HDU84_005989 [Entophlyctis sp. JEL0112]
MASVMAAFSSVFGGKPKKQPPKDRHEDLVGVISEEERRAIEAELLAMDARDNSRSSSISQKGKPKTLVSKQKQAASLPVKQKPPASAPVKPASQRKAATPNVTTTFLPDSDETSTPFELVVIRSNHTTNGSSVNSVGSPGIVSEGDGPVNNKKKRNKKKKKSASVEKNTSEQVTPEKKSEQTDAIPLDRVNSVDSDIEIIVQQSARADAPTPLLSNGDEDSTPSQTAVDQPRTLSISYNEPPLVDLDNTPQVSLEAYTALEAELVNLKEKLGVKSALSESQQQEIQKLSCTVDSVRSEYDKLKTEANTLSATNRTLASYAQTATAKSDSLVAENSILRQKIKSETAAAVASAVQAASAAREMEVAKLRQLVDAKEGEIQRLAEITKVLQAANADMRLRWREEVDTMRNDNTTAVESVRQAVITHFDGVLAEAERKRLDVISSHHSELAALRAAHEKELSGLHSSYEKQMAALAKQFEDDKSLLEGQVKTLTAARDKSAADLENVVKSHSAQIRALQHETEAEAKKSLEVTNQLKTDFSISQELALSKDVQIQSANDKISELQLEIEAQKEQIQSENSRILRALTEENNLLRSDLEVKNDKIVSLKATISKMESTVQSLKEKFQERKQAWVENSRDQAGKMAVLERLVADANAKKTRDRVSASDSNAATSNSRPESPVQNLIHQYEEVIARHRSDSLPSSFISIPQQKPILSNVSSSKTLNLSESSLSLNHTTDSLGNVSFKCVFEYILTLDSTFDKDGVPQKIRDSPLTVSSVPQTPEVYAKRVNAEPLPERVSVVEKHAPSEKVPTIGSTGRFGGSSQDRLTKPEIHDAPIPVQHSGSTGSTAGEDVAPMLPPYSYVRFGEATEFEKNFMAAEVEIAIKSMWLKGFNVDNGPASENFKTKDDEVQEKPAFPDPDPSTEPSTIAVNAAAEKSVTLKGSSNEAPYAAAKTACSCMKFSLVRLDEAGEAQQLVIRYEVEAMSKLMFSSGYDVKVESAMEASPILSNESRSVSTPPSMISKSVVSTDKEPKPSHVSAVAPQTDKQKQAQKLNLPLSAEVLLPKFVMASFADATEFEKIVISHEVDCFRKLAFAAGYEIEQEVSELVKTAVSPVTDIAQQQKSSKNTLLHIKPGESLRGSNWPVYFEGPWPYPTGQKPSSVTPVSDPVPVSPQSVLATQLHVFLGASKSSAEVESELPCVVNNIANQLETMAVLI